MGCFINTPLTAPQANVSYAQCTIEVTYSDAKNPLVKTHQLACTLFEDVVCPFHTSAQKNVPSLQHWKIHTHVDGDTTNIDDGTTLDQLIDDDIEPTLDWEIHTNPDELDQVFDELADTGIDIEPSLVTEIFTMRSSTLDILILIRDTAKLEIKQEKQHKIGRQQEREWRITHMLNNAKTYKSQGKWMMISSLGSGVLAIVSGICPIVGHMKGEWIMQKLSRVFSSLHDMDPKHGFQSIAKVLFAASEMYKSTGQVQNTITQGHLTLDDNKGKMRQDDEQDSTRSIDECKDNYRKIEDLRRDIGRMRHDDVHQLYTI